MNINEKTQFLFLITCCDEYEVYFFNSINEMLDFWKEETIEKLLKKYDTTFTVHIFLKLKRIGTYNEKNND